ncbi:MAG: hypothetical protein ACK5O7_02705 [Holosporales bacterium]
MPLIYRRDKGIPLTMEELDGNFQFLHDRLALVEQLGQDSGGAPGFTIEQQGDVLIFRGADRQTLGQFRIPIPHLSPRGTWQPQTTYAVLDLVHAEGGSYVCKTAHTSTSFAGDRAHWQPLLAASGKDLESLNQTGEATKSTETALPIYDWATLPNPAPGLMVVVADTEGPAVLVAMGQKWWTLATGCALQK